MVNDVEFIMGFAKTKNAVDKLSNGDKVKFYGNLLVNGYLNDKDKISVDEFDEYLELINSLSYRELEYLSFFKEHSDKHRGILIYQHWEEFSKEFENKFPKRDVDVYKRQMEYLRKNEVMLSELSQKELDQLAIYDEYDLESYKFQVLNYDIEVKDALIAEALTSLTKRKRDVILLSYFMGMSDAEIARKMKLVRSTVNEHRKRSLEILKDVMEEKADESEM